MDPTAKAVSLQQASLSVMDPAALAAVRSSGWFDIKDLRGRLVAQGVGWQYCRLVQRFSYGKEDAAPSSPRLMAGASGAAEGQ